MALPIDPLIPNILEHIRAARSVVIVAPPGGGKTTRVPPALLELDGRDVLVLEPRRLAARLAARFVAAERDEALGEMVGYQVRFEEVAGPRTRLRFLTEGVLTRRLLTDPNLRNVGTVVLDEFHERHLEGDLALALLRRLQLRERTDLKLAVMSATLDAEPVAKYLGGAPVVRSDGRQYPLDIEYTPHSAAPLEEQVAAALGRLTGYGVSGHILVFLPGAAEIRRAQNACAGLARRNGWVLLPLHGDQSPEEQDRAVSPCRQVKVILSTNVAESSVTIEGVAAVVDSGLARSAAHSPWSGLPTLQVGRISQASANQRAGRAGRTGPGRVIRLYPLEDFVRRPAHDEPEVMHADLAPAALLLQAMGSAGLASLDWLDAPPSESIDHAGKLLDRLGASGRTGRDMARYPVHPRLARLIVEAARRGVAAEGATIAGLLSAGERMPANGHAETRSDLFVLMESEWQGRTANTVRQIRRMAGRSAAERRPSNSGRAEEDALLISVLAAFPDRVARRRHGGDLQLASGGPAQLAPSSTVKNSEFVVAVEAEDRSDCKAPLVRIASAIEPEWLLDLFPSLIRETVQLEWNRAACRVEQVSALLFGDIAIEESRGTPEAAAAGTLLAEKAREAGIWRFAERDEIDGFLERAAFAAAHGDFPSLTADAPLLALDALACGRKSFAELEAAARDGGLLRALMHQVPAPALRQLELIAPERIRLPGGRQVRVHYEPGQPPWIASRLQDFFGMRETPAVARGSVQLVVRLLAPSQRPVQVTSDLAGFWQRLYPQVRKELARRYPKHAWPEDPLKASRN